jgi:beta-phosphoglucomutase-like phosphatase (HAD superfamily)
MPIKLYIFDWSGTLSDDRRPVYEANMRVLVAYGKQRMTFQQRRNNSMRLSRNMGNSSNFTP